MEIKTKFNLGDKVWYMRGNKAIKVIISAIYIFYVNTNQDHIKYHAKDAVNPTSWIDHQGLFEDKLFRSKDELLSSL